MNAEYNSTICLTPSSQTNSEIYDPLPSRRTLCVPCADLEGVGVRTPPTVNVKFL